MDLRLTRARGRLLFWSALVVVAVAALSMAQTSAGSTLLQAIGITPAPAQYVELFLDSRAPMPNSLPADVTVPLNVAFVVGNGDSVGRVFRWSVQQTPHAFTDPTVSSDVTVPAGGRVPQSATIPVTCSGDHVQVAVSVAGQAPFITHSIRCLPIVGGVAR